MSDHEYAPLEGNDTLLRSKARHYGEIANAIARSVNTLKSISSVEGMTSAAIDAIREKAGDVASDIDKAKERYAVTSQALVTYSFELKSAQDAARTAIAHIADKQSAVETAQRTATQSQHAADSAQPDDTEAKKAATDAHDHAQAASASLGAAHDEWRAALSIKNSAADAAIAAIVEVVDGKKNNGLKDGWWDDWGATFFDIIKVICDWAGILSIFLAWVPILGQILLVLAAIGAVITLIESIVKAISGDGSWWDVAGAAVGAVLTLFGGKIFAAAAKELKAITVLKSGITETRALATLQGVGAHSEDFMSASKAADNLAKPLSDVFKSPFVRTATQKAAFDAFKAGEKSAGTLIREAALEAFPKFDIDFAKGLNINADLKSFYKMAAENPGLVDLPMRFQAGALSLYQGIKVGQGLEAIFKPDFNGTSFVSGDYGDVVGGVTGVGDVFKHGYQIITTGTTKD
ncbi:hypothetical protein [Frigoribacterium sp. UYMn621]|uniref:hypothetical protein n=1 Tax=Frigoribacterium sp. UYMn621 TaxID=3156343 RepID=UPI00339116F3